MYRVMVVDDESYVVDWISELLETQTELEVDVCRAYSAKQALEWLERAKIDIILSDIRMPKMNGIELAEKVSKNWPNCKVILLTAYSEFQYAYEAIKNNVSGYILKDESDDYILNEVKKAACSLEVERKNLKALDDMCEQLTEFPSAAANGLLIEMFRGGIKADDLFFSRLESVGIHIDVDAPLILFAGLPANSAVIDIFDKYRIFSTVRKMLLHYLKGRFHCISVYDREWFAGIIQTIADESSDRESGNNEMIFIEGLLEEIQQVCKSTLGADMFFALRGTPIMTGQIPSVFRRLEGLLADQSTNVSGFVITDSCEEQLLSVWQNCDRPDRPKVNTRLAKEFADLMDLNRLSDAKNILDTICTELKNYGNWHDNSVLELYYSVSVSLISYINRHSISAVSTEMTLTKKDEWDVIFRQNDAMSWQNAADKLRKVFSELQDLQHEGEGRLTNNIIRAIKNYISTHITGDISLVRLSEVTGYNATYISHLFREHTGTTITDYAGRLRLLKIEELMADEKINIGEIASYAGFETRTSFNNFMRRKTGVSPQEYRTFLRQSQKK